ncbi:hypothetical protein CH92_21290 [Stutzerimonas stutzeri]|uniref:Uncharacterized protein n=1 Tax=Stutzerimonas stutzeri TaxID=316 RepID=W8R441_STUST|nr:hypothetical protein CH92_21290 [Stutzerimonas stutzeri]
MLLAAKVLERVKNGLPQEAPPSRAEPQAQQAIVSHLGADQRGLPVRRRRRFEVRRNRCNPVWQSSPVIPAQRDELGATGLDRPV